MKYTELPKDENPPNRIRDLGPMSLSASEVLAVALWVTDTETCHLFITKLWIISCNNQSSCRRNPIFLLFYATKYRNWDFPCDFEGTSPALTATVA
jgi:hypothetical protein